MTSRPYAQKAGKSRNFGSISQFKKSEKVGTLDFTPATF